MYCLSPPMSEPPEGMQENLSNALPAAAVTAARHQAVSKRLPSAALTTIGMILTRLHDSFSRINYRSAADWSEYTDLRIAPRLSLGRGG